MKRSFTIGTRGSDLALWQANFVKSRLQASVPAAFEIKVITTTGDRLLDIPLSKIGDKGLFTRQIESELINGRIDFAVHSLKDLQTQQPNDLTIAAICEREQPNDVLVSQKYGSIDELPAGARVATGSLRRRSQLLHYRPDLKVEEMRGNIPTRIKKFDESGLDAMILAWAGLQRLGLKSWVRQKIPFEVMLPAVGQGAIAVETRTADAEASASAATIDHKATRICAEAERAFLRRLEGGCQVPIGALAHAAGSLIRLDGMVGAIDGRVVFRETIEGSPAEAEVLGLRLAERLIAAGALRLLDESRKSEKAAEHLI